MLETEIKKLTAAVEANTAAQLGGAAATPVAATLPVAATPAAPVVTTAAIDIPVVAETPDIPVTPAAAPADLKMLTERIIALAKAKGRDAAGALLAEYGAARVPDLKKVPEKYDEIFAKINALIDAK